MFCPDSELCEYVCQNHIQLLGPPPFQRQLPAGEFVLAGRLSSPPPVVGNRPGTTGSV